MTHPPEPIPDLEIRPACPRCGGSVEADRTELANYGWRCQRSQFLPIATLRHIPEAGR